MEEALKKYWSALMEGELLEYLQPLIPYVQSAINVVFALIAILWIKRLFAPLVEPRITWRWENTNYGLLVLRLTFKNLRKVLRAHVKKAQFRIVEFKLPLNPDELPERMDFEKPPTGPGDPTSPRWLKSIEVLREGVWLEPGETIQIERIHVCPKDSVLFFSVRFEANVWFFTRFFFAFQKPRPSFRIAKFSWASTYWTCYPAELVEEKSKEPEDQTSMRNEWGMKTFKKEVSGTFYTQVYLWDACKELLKTSEEIDAQKEHRSFYYRISGMLMAYLAYEACLNYIGKKVALDAWENEREFFRSGKYRGNEGKLRIISERCGIPPIDKGRRPYQTVCELEELRDFLSHGKPWTFTKTIQHREGETPDMFPDNFIYEKCSAEATHRAMQDVEAFVDYLYELLKKSRPDDFPVNPLKLPLASSSSVAIS